MESLQYLMVVLAMVALITTSSGFPTLSNSDELAQSLQDEKGNLYSWISDETQEGKMLTCTQFTDTSKAWDCQWIQDEAFSLENGLYEFSDQAELGRKRRCKFRCWTSGLRVMCGVRCSFGK